MFSRIFLFTILFGLLSFMPSWGQGSFGIGIEGGVHLGWWKYNNGQANSTIFSNSALDYSHYTGAYSLNVQPFWKGEKWNFGLGIGFLWIDENSFRKHQLAAYLNEKYKVSKGFIANTRYFGEVAYKAAKTEKSGIGPLIRVGGWNTNVDHPNSGDFGAKWFFGLGFFWELEIHEKWTIDFRTMYQNNRIESNSDRNGNNWIDLNFTVQISYLFGS